MSRIEVIEGERFEDWRGEIRSLNSMDFDGVERVYFIRHPDASVVRGWHGHRFERKWFYCVRGAFTLAFVEPDDWHRPSPDLPAEIFTLSAAESRILCVPAGYANCVKARERDSVLLVFSDKRYADALSDSWRYDSSMWVDWSKY